MCTNTIHLDDEQLHHHRGNVSQFEAMRHQLRSKKETDWKLQEKTIKESMKAKGLNRKKAEEAWLAKSGRGALLAQPRDYRVKFQILDPPDSTPTVSVLGAGCVRFFSIRRK